uniref:Uncharacterized protein n=1 Tax=Ciona intestinalis TaxID=7719 RepID=H2Y1B7_CIOIN
MENFKVCLTVHSLSKEHSFSKERVFMFDQKLDTKTV